MQPQQSPNNHPLASTVIHMPNPGMSTQRFIVLVCAIVCVISLIVGWSQRIIAHQWRQQTTTLERQLSESDADRDALAAALTESEKNVLDLTDRLDDLAARYAQLQDSP